MDKHGKDLLLENLWAAALLGLLAILLGAASLVVDSASERKERAQLQVFASSKISPEAIKGRLPGTPRFYQVSRHGRRLYASVISIGDTRSLVRAAVFLSPDGRIDSVEALEVLPVDAVYGREGWFADFLGKGGDSPFPSSKADSRRPEALSGATESYLVTSAVLGSLSREIIELGGKTAGGL